jgi:hypothetical protein
MLFHASALLHVIRVRTLMVFWVSDQLLANHFGYTECVPELDREAWSVFAIVSSLYQIQAKSPFIGTPCFRNIYNTKEIIANITFAPGLSPSRSKAKEPGQTV